MYLKPLTKFVQRVFGSRFGEPRKMRTRTRAGARRRATNAGSWHGVAIAAETLEERALLTGPQLVDIQPNTGGFLVDGQTLNEGPRELTFKFSTGQAVDASTLGVQYPGAGQVPFNQGGIRITRAGDDGQFNPASVVSDFNTNGAVVLQIDSQTLGAEGNGINVVVTSAPLGTGSPTATVAGNTVTLTLNTQLNQTAQDVVNALNSGASSLVRASIQSGAPNTIIAASPNPYSPLVLGGANAAKATSSFNTGGPLQVQLTAKTAGAAGNNIQLYVTAQDLGAAAVAPTITVTGNRIDAIINSNNSAGNATTAQGLVNALNNPASASFPLVSASIPVGNAATVLTTTPRAFVPMNLGGANDQTLVPGYMFVDPNEPNKVHVRFAETLPNDLYRIEIIGRGTNALRGTSAGDNAFGDTTNDGVDNGINQRISFTLDYGAQITSIVPQPVIRTQMLNVVNTTRITNGDSFVVNAGGAPVTFQFRVTGSGIPLAAGAREVQITAAMIATDSVANRNLVANAIRTAINAASGASVLDVANIAALGATDTRVGITGNSYSTSTRVQTSLSGAMSVTDGALSQQLDRIVVYFTKDLLNTIQAQNPAFYQVIDTSNNTILAPSQVRYNAQTDSAVLLFASPLPAATYHVQIGAPSDPNQTRATSINLGTLFGSSSAIVSTATYDFRTQGNVVVQFTRRQSAVQGGANVTINFRQANLGVGVRPTVNVVGSAITVTLNSTAATPTTAQHVVDAINSSQAASALVSASILSGLNTQIVSGGSLFGSLNLPTDATQIRYDFNTNGKGIMTLSRNNSGNIGAISININSADLGHAAGAAPNPPVPNPPTYVQAANANGNGSTITITLNSDSSSNNPSPTTLQQVIDLINANSTLVTAALTAGNGSEIVGGGASPDGTLIAPFTPAPAITLAPVTTGAVYDFFTANAVNVRFNRLHAAGTDGNDVVINFVNADLGVGGVPTVNVTKVSTTNTITVTLNSRAGSLSTANQLVAAIAGNAAASSLVTATILSGTGTATIAKPGATYQTLNLPASYTTTGYLGDNVSGASNNLDDFDLYQFRVQQTDPSLPNLQQLTVTVTPSAGLNPFIRLFSIDANGVATQVDTAVGAGPGTPITLISNNRPSGTYMIGISSNGNAAYNVADGSSAAGGTTFGSYGLSINLSDPLVIANNTTSFDTATNIGNLGAAGNTISSSIKPVNAAGAPQYPQLPGALDEPGHLNIPLPYETGGGQSPFWPGVLYPQQVTPRGNSAVTPQQIPTYYYNFQSDYGIDNQGNTLFNVITAANDDKFKVAVRQILSIYGQYLGAQFVETADQGLTIAVGDIRSVDKTLSANAVSGIFGYQTTPDNKFRVLPGGALNPDSARVNVVINSNLNYGAAEYGGLFYRVAFHFLGKALGLNNAADAPGVMGSGVGGTSGVEQVFPGDINLLQAMRINPPDSTDINLYRFDLTQPGTLTAETLAQRLTNASLLDTVLTLYKETYVTAQATTDFNSNNAVRVQISAKTAGINGNTANGGPRIDFIKVNDGSANPRVDVTRAGNVITVRLNLDTAIAATAQDVVDALNTDTDSNTLVSAVVISGNAATNVRAPTINYSPLNLTGGANVRTNIARNDNYFGTDSRISLRLAAGTYYLAVTASGNDNFDPNIPNSGAGGRTNGKYQLDLSFLPDSPSASGAPPATDFLTGSAGVRLDGDADQKPGGVFDFWFKSASTIFVDKNNAASVTRNGSLANPYATIQEALNAAAAGQIVRIVGNAGADGDLATLGDALPYLIGFDSLNNAQPDGSTFKVPKGVTVMVDAGALFKLRSAVIDVGTSSQNVDRSNGVLQVLGTPFNTVRFDSLKNDAVGGHSDATVFSGPVAGDWGGIVFRQDSDLTGTTIAGQSFSRLDYTGKSTFLNWVNFATLLYGGGQVNQDSVVQVFSPVHIVQSRPTVGYNTIRFSADAPISADPNSFDNSLGRIGPDVHGNTVTSNTLNGFLIRIRVQAGTPIDVLSVPAQLESKDIPYILTQALLISGTPGGAVNTTFPFSPAQFTGRVAGSLVVDPGIIIKNAGSRIETLIGNSQFIAEGSAGHPIVFTSLKDDTYGAGGTFDTNGNLGATGAVAGDWGGMFFNPVTFASLDRIVLQYAGGSVPFGANSDFFNPIAIQQADVRITNSLFQFNLGGLATFNDGTAVGNRSGHLPNQAATIFIRGAQPIIVNNVIQNNQGDAINLNANSLNNEYVRDFGRSTGLIEEFADFRDNRGPMVRLNRLGNNTINGMKVRGEQPTTQTVWDDTDIVHVLLDEIVSSNLHSYGGVRLVSTPTSSLVVKLLGANAGFTATGIPEPIDNRIGGTVQLIGSPGFPVILTSLNDSTVGAGLDPNGNPQKATNNNPNSVGQPGEWRSVLLDKYSNDTNVTVINEGERVIGGDVNRTPATAEFLGTIAFNTASGSDDLPLGFQVHGAIATTGDVDVYSFDAQAGTRVWIDIGDTSPSLDTLLELIDINGVVLAANDNSLDDATLAGNPNVFRAPPGPIVANAALGGDYGTTNPRDAGMSVVLPGAAGTTNTYFIRVRSNFKQSPVTNTPGSPNLAFTEFSDNSKLNLGRTRGLYTMQIRLEQTLANPGSTVRYSTIKFATNGIEVRGLPNHSPMQGTTKEITGNNSFATAQNLGNLLASDTNSISVAGNLDTFNQVDWYRFDLNYDLITAIRGLNGSDKTWSAIFDIDWADGLARPDTNLSVFDQNGRLILLGTDSNIADDQPAPGQGNNLNDFSRGSVGKLDPYIGSVTLPAGTPQTATTTNLNSPPESGPGNSPGQGAVNNRYTYFVAVSSNAFLPQALNARYQSNALNPLVRLEPINSVKRIVEDHIGTERYYGSFSNLNTARTFGVDARTFTNQFGADWNVNDPAYNSSLPNGGNSGLEVNDSGLYGNRVASQPYADGGANSTGWADASSIVQVASSWISPNNSSPLFSGGNAMSNLDVNALSTHITPYSLNDVPVYLSFGSTMVIVNPSSGQTIASFPNLFSGLGNDVADIVIRTDGRMFATDFLPGDTGNNSRISTIDPGSGAVGTYGNDAVADADIGPAMQAFAFQDNGNASYQRLFYAYGSSATQGSGFAATANSSGSSPSPAVSPRPTAFFLPLGAIDNATIVGGGGSIGSTMGMAFNPNTGVLYGVSTNGYFYQINTGSGAATGAGGGVPPQITDPQTGAVVSFTGLSPAPQNLLQGAYRNMMFALTTTGDIYALNTTTFSAVRIFDDNFDDTGAALAETQKFDRFVISGTPAGGTFQITLNNPEQATIGGGTNGQGNIERTVPIAANAPASVSINQMQTLTLNGAPTGGTFNITFDNGVPAVNNNLSNGRTVTSAGSIQTTGPLPFNASAAQVQAALEALNTVNPAQLGQPADIVVWKGVADVNFGTGTTIRFGSFTTSSTNAQINFTKSARNTGGVPGITSSTINGVFTVTIDLDTVTPTTAQQLWLAFNRSSAVNTRMAATILGGNEMVDIATPATTPFSVNLATNIYAFTYQGQFRGRNLPLMTANTANLTGGDRPNISINETRQAIMSVQQALEQMAGIHAGIEYDPHVRNTAPTVTADLTGNFGDIVVTGGPAIYGGPGTYTIWLGHYDGRTGDKVGQYHGMNVLPATMFTVNGGGSQTITSTQRFRTTRVVTGQAGATGVAVSTADVNLWHPTTTRADDAGHGINATFDYSRGSTTGGVSYYFGVDQNPNANPSALSYQSNGAQYGVYSNNWQLDHFNNSTTPIGQTYNLPGGVKGSLVSDPFNLAGYNRTDKPTLYFNYFLDANNIGSFGVVSVSTDNGASWIPVASNKPNVAANIIGSPYAFWGQNINYLTTSINLDPASIEPLFTSTGTWRQAIVPLDRFAGYNNVKVRFDFTSNVSEPGKQRFSGIINSIGATNAEGFYIDDIIVGFAERGQMVTGGQNAQTNFFQWDPTAPGLQSLTGAYQLEIRRGAEYATTLTGTSFANTSQFFDFDTTNYQSHDVTRLIHILRQFDTNDPQTLQKASGFENGAFDTLPWNSTGIGSYIGPLSSVTPPAVFYNNTVSSMNQGNPGYPAPQSPNAVVQYSDPALPDFSNASTASNSAWTVIDHFANPLFPTYSGRYGLKSGTIGANQQSVLQITLDTIAAPNEKVGYVTFSQAISSEGGAGGGVLSFYIDNQLQGTITGEVPYHKVSYAVTPGRHTFSWVYSKGATAPAGQDAAFLDDIYLPTPLQGYGFRTSEVRDPLMLQGSQPTTALEQSNLPWFGAGLRGDENQPRPKGALQISANTISDFAQWGINVAAGSRDSAGNPFPAPPRNLPTLNTENLVSSVQIANNVIYLSTAAATPALGGITFTGDPNTGNVPTAGVPYGRIINNTIYGGPARAGTGISVDLPGPANANASPTIMNNIVANWANGIVVDASSASTVISGTLFQNNTANGSTGTNFIITPAAQQIFVNAAGGNFYPVEGAPQIDSSLNNLGDRSILVASQNSIGYPITATGVLTSNPVIAPRTDRFNQLRQDDPFVPNADGLGADIFKDRGAVERIDFVGPRATLVIPEDQGTADGNNAVDTYFVTSLDPIATIELELSDQGIGIDPTSVVTQQFVLEQRSTASAGLPFVRLEVGVDYTFTYNETTRRVIFRPVSVFSTSSDYRITVNPNFNTTTLGTGASAGLVQMQFTALTTTPSQIQFSRADLGQTAGVPNPPTITSALVNGVLIVQIVLNTDAAAGLAAQPTTAQQLLQAFNASAAVNTQLLAAIRNGAASTAVGNPSFAAIAPLNVPPAVRKVQDLAGNVLASNTLDSQGNPITLFQILGNAAPTLTTIANQVFDKNAADQLRQITYQNLIDSADESDRPGPGHALSFKVTSVAVFPTATTITRNSVTTNLVPGDIIGPGDVVNWTQPGGLLANNVNIFEVVAYDPINAVVAPALSESTPPVAVRANVVDTPPTLTDVATLPQSGPNALEDVFFTITYAALKAAANEADVNGDFVNFRIESVFGTANGAVLEIDLDGAGAGGFTPVVLPQLFEFNAGTPANTPVLRWKGPTNLNNQLNGGNPIDAFAIVATDGNGFSTPPITVRVNVDPVEDQPILTTVSQLGPAGANAQFGMKFADFVAATDAANVDGHPIEFRIEAQQSGGQMFISKNGAAPVPVVFGVTVFAAGDTLIWNSTGAPTVPGANAAFTVVAHDSLNTVQITSTPPVQVTINVLSQPAPNLTNVATLLKPRFVPTTIPFSELLAAANESIANGNPLSFRIEGILDGTLQLTRAGVTTNVVPGVTIFRAGDTLTYTSSNLAASTGLRNAFSVRAIDESNGLLSVLPVNVPVDLQNFAPTLTTVSNFTGGFQQTAFDIPFANLLIRSNAADANNDALTFRINGINQGTLTMSDNGGPFTPITIGATEFGPGDVLRWTPPNGVIGNAVPAFTVTAHDGLVASAPPVQVTVELIAFGASFNLTGPWNVNGQLARIQQNGASVTTVQPSGSGSPGTYVAFNQITATSFGSTGTIDTTPHDKGRIQWVGGTLNGQTWLRIFLGGQWANPAGGLVSIEQNDVTLTFVDTFGNRFQGTFVNATTVRVPNWAGMVMTGTLTNDGTINWSNGNTWRKLNLSPTFTTNVDNSPVGIIDNGTTTLTFVNRVGGTAPGFWINSTQVRVPMWGNIVGTVGNGQIQWSNGVTWNKNLNILGTATSAPGAIGIGATNAGVTVTNRAGTTVTGQIIAPNTIQVQAWGITGVRQGGKITWRQISNNAFVNTWENFDFNALDAVFSDIRNFPFG
jgi:hypothetical protein